MTHLFKLKAGFCKWNWVVNEEEELKLYALTRNMIRHDKLKWGILKFGPQINSFLALPHLCPNSDPLEFATLLTAIFNDTLMQK